MSLRKRLTNWRYEREQKQREQQREETVRIGKENAKLIQQVKAEGKRTRALEMREGLLQEKQRLQERGRGKGGSGWDRFDRGVATFGKGVGRAVQSFDKAVDTLAPPTKSRGQGSMFDSIGMGGGGRGFNPITGESYGGVRHPKKHGGTAHYVKRHGKYVKVGKHSRKRHRESPERGFNPIWG